MKPKAFCFTLLLLLILRPANCQGDDQMNDFQGDAPANKQEQEQEAPLITSRDSLTMNPDYLPQNQNTLIPDELIGDHNKLDQNTDEEARADSHPIDERAYKDSKEAIDSINQRIAGVPGVDQSMDAIYQTIVDKFKQINCRKNSAKAPENAFIQSLLQSSDISSTDMYSLCDEDIAPVVFTPLSNPNTTRTALFQHFRDNIYQPLGYEMPEHRFSYADTISDLINLDPDNSIIHKNMHGLNFDNFSGTIAHAFEEVESAATNFDKNKGLISRQMIDILKSFHIFWNVLRQKNRIGQSRVQTLAIVKALMHKFKQTNAAMKAATLNILENIKEAYFRFMRAHKYQKLISKQPLETIAFQLLERYKANVIKIKERATDEFTLVSELAVFLDMLRAFHLINKKDRLTPEESLTLFEKKIAQPITNTYNVYQDVMVQNGDSSFYKVRDFTAVLLLKFKQRNHVMMEYYGWDDYFKAKDAADGHVFDNVVKFYEELVDGVMLVPAECHDYVNSALDQCVKQKIDGALSDYSKKYMLQASISGVNLYHYISQEFDKAINDLIASQASQNTEGYKGAYVSRLSQMFKKFRADYRINDMSDVEQLENNIGFQIEKIKAINSMKPLNLALIDAFDKSLYSFFLEVKSAYNAYAPVSKDPRVVNSIAQRLQSTIENFRVDHIRQITDETKDLLRIAIKESKIWVQKHSVQYVVNTHPVNMRLEPANPLADAQLNRMNVNDITLNIPSLGSSMMPPMAEQAADFSSQIGNQAMIDTPDFKSKKNVV